MKATEAQHITTSILAISLLSSCSFGASMPAQITSLNVSDCEMDSVQISDQSVELNGTETWTAKCNGKKYSCDYLSESGSNCYEETD